MSRFVSGGTVDEPVQRDEAWLKAQQDIEAKRRQKEDEGRQTDGKSLYETLQANKAAKQDAFEESIRLKNQFRSLDQDEVEFLDAVLESTRAKEDAVRKETAEQLDAFRRQQEDTEKAAVDPGVAETNDAWAFHARKRKRAAQKEATAGLKLRKPSVPPAARPVRPRAEVVRNPPRQGSHDGAREGPDDATPPLPAASPKPAVALGLAAYSSDSD